MKASSGLARKIFFLPKSFIRYSTSSFFLKPSGQIIALSFEIV